MKILTAAVIILSISLISLLAAHILYRRQIKKICRRLAFIREHNTNMQLYSDLDFKELNRLESEINNIIEKSRSDSLSAKQSEDSLKETIANISHDIRTPLTSLDGYFQLLSDSESKEERQRYIGIISSRISSLKNMLEELFTYTKLQNEAYVLSLEDVNFSKSVCDALFSFYDDFTAAGIEPVTDFTDEKLIVNGNAEALSRIIRNILKNALEHGTDELKLKLESRDGQAVFSCSNRTPHPEEIDINRVFARFYRSDSSRSRTSTGLGLAIAKGLAEKMNGTATASLDGDFFTVTVCLMLN